MGRARKQELISQREYARRRGISHVAVQRAVASGRISIVAGKIDPVRADHEWTRNTDQSKPRNRVTGRPRLQREPGEPPQPMDLDEGWARPCNLPESVHDRRTVEVWYALPNPQRFEDCNKWLPGCNRVRRGRRGCPEPEIWFRIVHVAVDGADGAPVAAYHEQTVEIALGPKEAFENDNIGTLTRRVAADRVVHGVPSRVLNRKPPKAPRTPRVVELLRKAIEWQALIESGEASNQAAIAGQEGITRARVTQVMGLLRLAPEIQEHVLYLPDMIRRPAITERALRRISRIDNPPAQIQGFQVLLAMSHRSPGGSAAIPKQRAR